MILSHNALDYLSNMFPTWHMVTMDSMGHSGGPVALWDPMWVDFNPYNLFAGILLSRHIERIGGTFQDP